MIAVKSIIPKKIDVPAMDKVWLEELEEYGKFIIRDFEKTVAPWSGAKPSFVLARYVTAQGTTLVVRITGNAEGVQKWWWRELGTKPHTIRAKSAKTLAFPSVYHRGSTPGKLFVSRATSGGETIFSPVVQHPGTEARNMGALIAAEHEKPFQSWMQNAEPRVAKASGHAIK